MLSCTWRGVGAAACGDILAVAASSAGVVMGLQTTARRTGDRPDFLAAATGRLEAVVSPPGNCHINE
eukprot:6196296-Pleurochrysis_carterae.AAC.1